MSEPISASRNFEVLTAQPVRLESGPSRSYRNWSADEKARIIGQTFVPGANVSAIARSYDIEPSQLFGWRRKALASGTVAPIAAPGIDAPVQFTRFETVSGTAVEIMIGDAVVRAGPGVDGDHLAAVIRAVRQA